MSRVVIRRVSKRSSTVIDDAVFRDTGLSYKEVGIYCQIVNQSKTKEESGWDFSLAGMAGVHRDGVDAVRSGVQRLEKAGYLIRAQKRDASNQFTSGDQEWVIFDCPDVEDWSREASELMADGFTLMGLDMDGADHPEMAKPQVTPVVGKSNDGTAPVVGKSNDGKIVENSAKSQVAPVVGFPVVGKSNAIYGWMDGYRDLGVDKTLPVKEESTFSGYRDLREQVVEKAGEGQEQPGEEKGERAGGFRLKALAHDPVEALMAEDWFKAKARELKQVAVNRNRIHEADEAFARLVLQGYDPDEIIAEFTALVFSLKAQGRKDRFQVQLTKWLELDAAEFLDAKVERELAFEQKRAEARTLNIEEFNADSYEPGKVEDAEAFEQQQAMAIAGLRLSDPGFDTLAAKVESGEATVSERMEYAERVKNAPPFDLARMFRERIGGTADMGA